jgi:diaminopimelate epimerase
MAGISFSKLSGSGNDFILIDNRDGRVPKERLSETARRLCRRKFSVGADGFIALERSETADFRWQFFNADGSTAEMCGNGGRCAARFAAERGLAGERLCFETLAGTIRAEVRGSRVKLELPPPGAWEPDREIPLDSGSVRASSLHTGVPHAVVCVEDLEAVDVEGLGRRIRFHPLFRPAGTNADFIRRGEGNRILLRTYERGVEAETLACGTGAVAGACVASHRWALQSPVEVLTRGGEVLTVFFSRDPRTGRYGDLFLEGGTLWVYDGTATEESLG